MREYPRHIALEVSGTDIRHWSPSQRRHRTKLTLALLQNETNKQKNQGGGNIGFYNAEFIPFEELSLIGKACFSTFLWLKFSFFFFLNEGDHKW